MKTPCFLRLFLAIFLASCFGSAAFALNDGFTHVTIGAALRDISSSGTFVPLADDEVSGAVPIGFSFSFYGSTYTEAYISSNGFITFSPGQSNGCCSGDPFPDPADPNNVVAGYWEDLNLPQGNIRYETLGTAPNREFVVGFYDNPHFNDGPRVTFEMILHEGSGQIEFQYASAPSDGGTHSVGVENATGTIGHQVAYGDLTFENTGFLLTPQPIGNVPTMNRFGLATLILLMGLLGLFFFRSRHRV